VYLCSEDSLGEVIIRIFLEIFNCFFLDYHSLDPFTLNLLDYLGDIFNHLFKHEHQTPIGKRDIRSRDEEKIGKSIDGKRIISNRSFFPFLIQIDTISADEREILGSRSVEASCANDRIDFANFAILSFNSIRMDALDLGFDKVNLMTSESYKWRHYIGFHKSFKVSRTGSQSTTTRREIGQDLIENLWLFLQSLFHDLCKELLALKLAPH